jgi:Protein of unknown function (DUF998)
VRGLGRLATAGAAIEVTCWAVATLLSPGSWRYDISALYAAGSPRPWLVMIGETALGVALAALALGLRGFLPRSDHRMIGCAMLAVASLGAFASGLARDSCEESVPSCSGLAYATPSDWVEAGGSVLVILGISAAALALAAKLPRRWSAYSAATGCVVLGSIVVWQAVPYPWVGTAERVLALALVGWVGGLGAMIAHRTQHLPSNQLTPAAIAEDLGGPPRTDPDLAPTRR